mmetsp:Transcript_10450/g.18245  ORF Transcript_10450/g.18245 Transcript_10450/m.18245 type:complete len:406 (+) Transcript_10450:56-1273(+)
MASLVCGAQPVLICHGSRPPLTSRGTLRLALPAPLLPVPCLLEASTQTRCVAMAAVRRQQQSKRRKGRGENVEDVTGFEEDDPDYEMVATSSLPRAPAIADTPLPSEQEEKPYPVFAPKPSAINQQPWSWSEDGKDNNEAPIPEWNPKTGFMGSPSFSSRRQAGSSRTGRGSSTEDVSPEASAAAEPQIDLLSPSAAASGEDLPKVTQSQVLGACFGTTLWMTVLGLFLRAYAQTNAPNVLGTDEVLLAQYLAIPSGFGSWTNAGILLGSAGVVSLARFQLLNVWPDFQSATERSNKQILSSLSWVDMGLVATLSGVSEELLFRGAIIPGTFLDWRGVLISGVIFGALHNSGGRNPAFAAWAGAVGCLYGGAFLVTKNIWVPAAAHVLANFISAAAWKNRNPRSS